MTDQNDASGRTRKGASPASARVIEPQKRPEGRGAFGACFVAAMLLTLLCAAGAIVLQMSQAALFRAAVTQNVVAYGLVSQSDADRFADDTIAYIAGASDAWEPVVTISGHPLAVPDAFKAHMANVRAAVRATKVVLVAYTALALGLLAYAVCGRRGFSRAGYYGGALVPLLALAGIGAWGYADFDGLWAWIHTTFIPDGIFAAGEEIMLMFPLNLFASYLLPVAFTFGAMLAILWLLPLALSPLSRRLAASRQP